jgi:queuine tRNA-ribosyltransferase
MVKFGFELLKTSKRARLGKITTAHGEINTPAFMPVGTCASVKGMLPEQILDTGSEIILGNTYHLMLRPTAERIAKLGGLHKFMNWHKPILTDSGGFQVMSLSGLRKITEEGVKFKSHIDGSTHMLTSERSMEIQHLLGSDITMIFDDCPEFPITEAKALKSMEMSLRWAERSKKAYIERPGHALFAIVQGSTFRNLREKSAKELIDIGFDGYAIGGLAVGEGHNLMVETLEYTEPMLPKSKPRYLMGVGKPKDLIAAVRQGIDMFDCVLPTRSGRNGQVFTWDGPKNLRNEKFKESLEPIDAKCCCYCCKNYKSSYLNHLLKAKEINASVLLSIHNIHFYQDLMKTMREHIKAGTFEEFADKAMQEL